MGSVGTKGWFIATIAGWALILLLDELTYFWWRKANPSTQYSGIIVKHPTTIWSPPQQ